MVRHKFLNEQVTVPQVMLHCWKGCNTLIKNKHTTLLYKKDLLAYCQWRSIKISVSCHNHCFQNVCNVIEYVAPELLESVVTQIPMLALRIMTATFNGHNNVLINSVSLPFLDNLDIHHLMFKHLIKSQHHEDLTTFTQRHQKLENALSIVSMSTINAIPQNLLQK